MILFTSSQVAPMSRHKNCKPTQWVLMLVALAGFSQNTRAENPNPIAGVVAEVMIASPLDQVAGDRIGAGVRDLVQDEQIPQAVNGSFVLPDLKAASTVQNLDRLQQVPKDFRDEQTVPTIALPESGSEREENWDWTEVQWAAANTYSNPRYFEDRMLERHGHQTLGKLQPLASGARFFVTIPLLPYLTAVSEPDQKDYSLGYYRTGNSVPALRQRPPYERRALLSETAVISGFFLLVP